MCLHHPLHRAARCGQELPHHPDPVEAGLAAAEVTGDEDRQGHAVEILLARVGVQLGLVPKQCGHLAGVDGAAHPGQQRRVVRRRAGRLVHPSRRPQPHSDHGLAQYPLHGPTHPQVCHKRQRRHQLGEAHLPRGIRSHHPILPSRAPVTGTWATSRPRGAVRPRRRRAWASGHSTPPGRQGGGYGAPPRKERTRPRHPETWPGLEGSGHRRQRRSLHP